jgi:hypothetical protein
MPEASCRNSTREIRARPRPDRRFVSVNYLLEFHRVRGVAAAGLRPLYAIAVHPPERVPAALNGFALSR